MQSTVQAPTFSTFMQIQGYYYSIVALPLRTTVGTLEDLPLPLALLDCEALSIVAQNSDEARRRVWGRDPGFHAE